MHEPGFKRAYLYFMQKMYVIVAAVCLSLCSNAQVAVRNEPRHHNVFENDYIRILDVFLPPYDTTQFHVHNTPSVFTTFTKTATSTQLLGKEPIRSMSAAGNSWYDSLTTQRVHRVWNDDTSWFHVMDIEFIGGKPHTNPASLQSPAMQLFFNEPLANGYHLQLLPDNVVQLPPSAAGYLLLSIGTATIEYKQNDYIQHRIMKSGHYLWIDAGRAFALTSAGEAPVAFLLLQLK
jgi:hypothetical protein